MKTADMPASPINNPDLWLPVERLTKREYFAAHAPDVPDWFLPADQAYANRVSDHKKKAEIFFEWRVFYANKMLAELEKQNDPT